MNKIYAGIGSRHTPDNILEIMISSARFLASKGYTLRSGGAIGADLAFEVGCESVGGKKEIYLPYKQFNGSDSNLYELTPRGSNLAIDYHPLGNKLSEKVRPYIIRNGYQVLGYDLFTPVDFIICWTKNGKADGGTGQAIRIANDYDIKVYNLKNEKDSDDLRSFFKEIK